MSHGPPQRRRPDLQLEQVSGVPVRHQHHFDTVKDHRPPPAADLAAAIAGAAQNGTIAAPDAYAIVELAFPSVEIEVAGDDGPVKTMVRQRPEWNQRQSARQLAMRLGCRVEYDALTRAPRLGLRELPPT